MEGRIVKTGLRASAGCSSEKMKYYIDIRDIKFIENDGATINTLSNDVWDRTLQSFQKKKNVNIQIDNIIYRATVLFCDDIRLVLQVSKLFDINKIKNRNVIVCQESFAKLNGLETEEQKNEELRELRELKELKCPCSVFSISLSEMEKIELEKPTLRKTALKILKFLKIYKGV